MTKTKLNYEYQYSSKQLTHIYSYLTNPILSILPNPQTKSSDERKIRILDLGCGNGSFSHMLTNLGYDVVGVEESASGIAIATQNFPETRFIQGSLYQLPLEVCQNQFDIVISIEVIEHLFYPRELPRAAKQCLKPGGTLIVTTPFHGYLKNVSLALTGKLDAHFTTLWDGGHIKFFSVPTLKKLLISEGFASPKFRFSGRFPFLWKSMICAINLPH
ncbi:class I SAM-dependent methyltransferase [Altericista sp. CCNU0014]|uniref:class I SAM-dependent methyltransferase n=1 Tax=Altericista sp. CCNU0014 TaxID=3082949 RepID=UPI00384CFD29